MNPSDLLSLPTDSLYKFIAISGVALVLISAIFPQYLRKQYKFGVYELRRDLDLLILSRKTIDTKLEDLRNRQLESKSSTVRKSEETIWISDAKEIENEQRELRRVMVQLDCDTKKIEYLSGAIKKINFFTVIGLIVGAISTVSGFYFWYIKLQVYVDNAVVNGITP